MGKTSIKQSWIIILLTMIFIIYIIISGFYIVSLNNRIHQRRTNQLIEGTFITEGNTREEALYFVVDHDGVPYWYKPGTKKQGGFYYSGHLERINDENIYRVDFEERQFIVVYYEDSILLIDGENAYYYNKTDEYAVFNNVDRSNEGL